MTDEEFLTRMKAARARFREAKMKAHFPVNAKMRQELEAYAHEAVLKERADIGNRAVYLVLLAMDQAGLDRDTMCRGHGDGEIGGGAKRWLKRIVATSAES